MIKRILLITLGVVVITLVTVFACQRHSQAKALDVLTPDQQVLYVLTENQCLSCHSDTPKLPFYATWPVAKNMIAKDVHIGRRSVHLDPVVECLQNEEQPSEVALAKMEQCAVYNTMPPLQFKAVHWSTMLDQRERDILLDWVARKRQDLYHNGLSAEEFRNEPVRPLVDSLPVDPAKVALGFRLFHDVRLSKNNTISCATCHSLDSAGVDLLQFSKGIHGQIGGINAPTVFNAAFNMAQFWDGRKDDLAAQAGGPPFDALEMGSESWDEVIAKLDKDPSIMAQFSAVYDDGCTGDNIMDAIAEFEKTLITPNSKFDRYLKGDKNALTADEIQGYALFKKYNCAICHVGQALGGQSFEYMGVVDDYFANRQMKADRDIIKTKDQGHFNATGKEKDLQRFKTPNLRNVALTPPYLHDGTAATLDEATRVMLQYQVGEKVSDEDVAKMVLFMHTLTGEYAGRQLK